MRREYWIGVAILLALTFVGYQNSRIAAANRRAAASALRVDSLEAEADTTRRLYVTGLRDTVGVYQRRVVQAQQDRDALDRALGLERRARADLVLRLDSLRATLASGTTVDSADVRRATFAGRMPPYTVAASVRVPPPPAPSEMDINIALDPVPVGLRLGCHPAGADGIRKAEVTVTAPSWAKVGISAVTQAPDVCLSPALMPKPKKRWPWLVAGVALGIIGWEVAR